MAIKPHERFPSQTKPATAAYPLGSAQNITVEGDNTGTPWRSEIVDDFFGFFQSLLQAGGVTANGDPDSVTNSQYLTALQAIIAAGIGPTETNYLIATNGSQTITYGTADHRKYQRLTNTNPISITLTAPQAIGGEYGHVVTIRKQPGSGDITVAGDSGITVNIITGGSLTITDDGKVASFVTVSATEWDMIV